ncbi:Long-chain-fatty-acid--CoA ligase [Paraburkholderia caffeinitolerans]|uniref:Long-chain-fatty-acid--CoA ligase n=2 Tax=Paraburkholderia caffeinitolerans TaxID=1723730 RepID=A0A6J5GEE6_9BURK|nr:Long-chain-fatty-acid--CoA ligase [Paraburkholderia caffeinitolerans]
MGRELSYAELDARSRHLAGWLQSHGLERGARVAVMLPNLLQYPVALVAILRAGYTAVNIDPRCTACELEHRLIDSGAQVIVLLDACLPALRAMQPNKVVRHAVVTSVGEMLGVRGPAHAGESPGMTCTGFGAAIALGAEAGFRPVRLAADDIAVLQYTDGAAGVSMSTALRHRDLIVNLLQWQAWCEPVYRLRAGIEQRVTVAALPLYHPFGLTVCGLLTMRCGGLGILIPDARDVPGIVKTLRGYKIHSFPGDETLYEALLNEPEFARLDFSELADAGVEGAVLPPAIAIRWEAVTGVPIASRDGALLLVS